MWNRYFSVTLRVLLLAGIAQATANLHAEDSDQFRPYFRFHSGDIEPLWGVDDHWSLGLGANLSRHWGVELAFDYYLKEWGKPEVVGEASSYHLLPEVRWRFPLLRDRLVPYLVAGVGPSWIQSKDTSTYGYGRNANVESFTFAAAAGAGLEYFISDNVALGIEGRYIWVNPVDGSVDGREQSVDLSAALFTFGLRVFFNENKPVPMTDGSFDSESRFYFGVRMGADFLVDNRWVSGVHLRPEQAAWGGTASQTGGLLLGANFGSHFGFEIAGDHVNHFIDVDGVGKLAEYGQGWVLGNVRFRFPKGRWVPYVCAGAGVCFAEFKDYKPSSVGLDLVGERFHPALGVGAGVEYFITHNFSLNADARYAYSWGHSFGIENYLPTAKGDISYFAATIGFRVYLFNL